MQFYVKSPKAIAFIIIEMMKAFPERYYDSLNIDTSTVKDSRALNSILASATVSIKSSEYKFVGRNQEEKEG